VKNSVGKSKEITKVIRKFVPNAQKEPRVGSELNYLLPHESSPNFEELFDKLERDRKELGIDSFGASVTTMEEVFIKYTASTLLISFFCRTNRKSKQIHNILPAR